MHGIVFWSSYGEEILGIVALQALHEFHAHATSEVGIFAISLLSTSPAWVAKNVDVRRPDGESEENAVNIVAHCLVVLGARFSRNHRGYLVLKTQIPCGRESNGLGKQSGITRAGNTVQPFAPVVVLGNTQSGNRRRVIIH